MSPVVKLGSELQVGDVFAPWFERKARIVSLTPYTGRLAHLWSGKARIARMAPHGPDGFKYHGMTIDPNATFNTFPQE